LIETGEGLNRAEDHDADDQRQHDDDEGFEHGAEAFGASLDGLGAA
jgi:hypothetical protein